MEIFPCLFFLFLTLFHHNSLFMYLKGFRANLIIQEISSRRGKSFDTKL